MLQSLFTRMLQVSRHAALARDARLSAAPGIADAPSSGRELDEAELRLVVGGLATPALDLFEPPIQP